jgi:hypothetical protein
MMATMDDALSRGARSSRSDARLWALLIDEFRAAGAMREPAEQHARRAVAVVRRERTKGAGRTYAPGEEIPHDVAQGFDVDGDVWDRQGSAPTDALRDSWKMRGFDPDQHEPASGGVWLTPHLLERYGPITELQRPGSPARTADRR